MTAPGTAPVVEDFEPRLAAFIRARVPGPDADDVLQDTLLRLHLGLPHLRAGDRLAPYVFRVARSAVVDHQRRAGVRRRRFPLVEAELPAGIGVEPLVEAAPEALLAACIEPFLAQLPPEQAEALRLVDMAGSTQAAAARALGVPVPTLKARVRRGRQRLRSDLEACCAVAQDRRGAVIEVTPRCACP